MKIKRIVIFTGFKILELICLGVLVYGLAWAGWLFDQLVEGIGHVCEYNIHAFPDFLLFVFMGIAMSVMMGVLVYGLCCLIKKNWEWAGRY